MDENKKSINEQLAAFSNALKPSSTALKAMENIGKSLSKINIPEMTVPSYRHLENLKMPSQEDMNEYQSASVLMRALANEALQWKQNLPSNFNPAILAVLYGGIQIHVNTLSQVSFHGIRIEGLLNGAPCSLLAHQSTIQVLCYAEEVKPNEERRPIGFIWDDNKIEV